ncbi:glycosyltransferase family 2 protein [Chryseobacterium paridis]|uniref:Glycosyltransferase family 2 protein n=1 Tax=Chryseobacterium paridis TaxID=2800328 RepID=A0ABS1FZ69_9FLAO|nr:glycosyltransferase family A protein [Chryseobacterium paridis]MBK1897705.1 glycosyltransferase family 2 protein [Chryseobacterium paridis]
MNSIGKENKVSIVLPLYNAESTIAFSVGSVLEQTYKNWELIIINDGSIDNSSDVLTDFINKQTTEIKDKIIFISQENKGPSYTRNKGIKLATGDFIAFLDSDDLWVNEKLHWQIDYLNKFKDIGIIGGGFNTAHFSKQGDFIKVSYHKLLFRNFFLTPTVMIRKDFLDQEDYYFNVNKKFCEDQDLWLRLTYKREGICLNRILAKNIVGKANFGESGLSANLDLMHKGEIENFISQYKQKHISIITLLIISGFSYLKYYRRKWITRKRNF